MAVIVCLFCIWEVTFSLSFKAKKILKENILLSCDNFMIKSEKREVLTLIASM